MKKKVFKAITKTLKRPTMEDPRKITQPFSKTYVINKKSSTTREWSTCNMNQIGTNK